VVSVEAVGSEPETRGKLHPDCTLIQVPWAVLDQRKMLCFVSAFTSTEDVHRCQKALDFGATNGRVLQAIAGELPMPSYLF